VEQYAKGHECVCSFCALDGAPDATINVMATSMDVLSRDLVPFQSIAAQ
jgi:hypothetical protein